MDKFILITGGTKGIGKAVASCLGKAGYNLTGFYSAGRYLGSEYDRAYRFFLGGE